MSSKRCIAPITVVHETKIRLRLRLKRLRSSKLDPNFLEATLEVIPGVELVRVNTRAASVVVEYDGRAESRLAILSCLADLPQDVFNGNGKPKTLLSMLPLAAKGSLALSMLFMPPLLAAPIAFVLSVPVILEGVVTLWRKGVKVEVLDGAAVLFSLARRDFFTASSIVFLLSVGEYLEEQSENRSTGLLKSLLKPQVPKLWIEIDGQEIEIPFEDARIGDRVICGPGEMVPLDGVVVQGDASVNASSITGESVPVHVQPGSDVLSGSVVEDGKIIFEATHVGSESSMARISSFLENSLKNQSESQKKSDELADRLVPVTFGLGLGLLTITGDLQKAAAVLTVDYSCAIKLVNPVTMRVAMFNGAHQGVLLKGAQALDGLARVDTLIFDKTGTLTRGQLEVTDVHAIAGYTDDELLILAASAEEHYSHPVAGAVVEAAKSRGLELEATSQVDFIVAHGVSAYVNEQNVLVGSRHFIEDDEQIDCSSVTKIIADLEDDGKSILYVACGEKLVGIIGLRDELRPESKMVLRRLKESGIEQIIILTGDSKATANALAKQLDAVDQVHAELKPEEKAQIVKELKAQGGSVGFIGDGVNDAPALVSAHVGICLPGGADLAKESAQVILLHDDLRCLLSGRLIALHSQETLTRSFWAVVGLNSSFLLLASLGILQPVGAALLHNLSTVGILGYGTLRGRRYQALEDNNNFNDEL